MPASGTMWLHLLLTFISTTDLSSRPFYHVVNVNSIEAKLFAIRYGINQATSLYEISKIAIVTNLIYFAKRIFDLLSHLFQIHAVSILYKLQNFFALNQENSIEF